MYTATPTRKICRALRSLQDHASRQDDKSRDAAIYQDTHKTNKIWEYRLSDNEHYDASMSTHQALYDIWISLTVFEVVNRLPIVNSLQPTMLQRQS